MHMMSFSSNWSNTPKGIKGTVYVPMGSPDIVVSVTRIGQENRSPDLFTFDARSMIAIAAAMFNGEAESVNTTDDPEDSCDH